MANIGGLGDITGAFLEQAADTRAELDAELASAKEAFADSSERSNPFAARIKKKKKSAKARAVRVRKGEKAEKKEGVLKEQAEQFEKGNPELNQDSLKNLHGKIKKGANRRANVRGMVSSSVGVLTSSLW